MRLVSGRDHSIEAARRITSDFIPGEFYGWLAFAGDAPVAVTMLEPCVLEHAGTRSRAGYWRYLWVSPDYRKTTLYPRLVFTMIAEAAEAGIDLVYGAIRRPEVAAGHLALGMQKVGEIPVLAKPLRPARLFSKFYRLGKLFVRWSMIPDLVYGSYLWLRRSFLRQGYFVTEARAAETRPQIVIAALRELYSSELQRPLTAETFERRYRVSPDGTEYRVLCVEASGEMRAAIVHRTAIREGIHSMVVMEMGYRFSDQEALHFGLAELEKQALKLDCEVILCLSSNRTIQSLLRKWGYFESNETYVLMKKPTGRNVDSADAGKIDDWYFSFADHDAF